MTIDELKQFSTTYDYIQQECRLIFDVLERLEAKYKIGYGMQGYHSFESFDVDEGVFILDGRWSGQGDWSETTYTVTFEQFLDMDSFFKDYEKDLIARKQSVEEKQRASNEAKAQKEYEKYLELKKKYEGSENGKV